MADIVFMGSPDFAVPSLQRLLVQNRVLAVVTQPDRPAGRKLARRKSPVKLAAEAAGIPVLQPLRLRAPAAIEQLRAWQAELYVVVAYGQILPQAVLDIPPRGVVNVHASLLPRWRGAAPIQAAIRAGDTVSGLSIMLLDAGLDTGPVLAQRRMVLHPRETGASLHDKMAQAGAELLAETLPRYLTGELQPQAQASQGSSYAARIKKAERFIDWTDSAQAIDRHVRAFYPAPGTRTLWRGQELKILAGAPLAGQAAPGFVHICDGQLAVGTGEGLYRLEFLQLPGRQALASADFLRGQRDFIGAQLARE